MVLHPDSSVHLGSVHGGHAAPAAGAAAGQPAAPPSGVTLNPLHVRMLVPASEAAFARVSLQRADERDAAPDGVRLEAAAADAVRGS